MRDHSFEPQRGDQSRQDTRVVQSIRSITGDENVNISRSLLPSTIAAHNFDPYSWIDNIRLFPNTLEDLLALIPRNPTVEVFVKIDSDLEMVSLRKNDCSTDKLARRQAVILSPKILDRPGAFLVELVGQYSS